MHTVEDFAKDMDTGVSTIRNDLLRIVSKCLQWGEECVSHLQLREAKVVGEVLFLRFIASNDYLAIDVGGKKIYQANRDFREVPGNHPIDTALVMNITKELRQRYSKASPVSF